MIDDANIWRFNVAGSKEVRDYRVKGNYVCDNTQSALELGADLAIQSIHKTLPSLTQTALLHVNLNRDKGGPYVDIGRLERFLQIYQSSSPSYVFMAVMEQCIF